jgi:hypothetical protein
MAGLTRLRVKALQPSRRRAGFAFSREPRDLTADELGGENVTGFTRLLALLDDPQLSCSFVLEDGDEQVITADKVAQLRAALASWQAAEAEADAQRSMLANPATAELARKLLADDTELQPASGAVGEAGGAAASPAEPAATSEAPGRDGASENSPGNTSSSAEGVEQSRQAADVSAPDQKAGADEGNQPEGTPAPPVAEPNDEPTAEPAAAPRRGKQRSH